MTGLRQEFKRDTETECWDMEFINGVINALDRQTDNSVAGPLRVQTPALEIDSTVGTLKRGDQGPPGRSRHLFLHYSERK